jgi:predicted nuclease of predicted toxin-antitoxin system
MRIKVDEDLPKAATQLLREKGFEAISVVEQKMGGVQDSTLWQVVQNEQRFLVTADKGFGDIRAFPPGMHAGVLLLRPEQDGIRPAMELLEQVVTGYDLHALAGAVTVATPRGVRIRRARS